MKTPNIFKIATSELSQDAFITWILKWADSSFADQNPELNKCAVEFVQELIGSSDSIISVKAGRQWKNIDVWAIINEQYFLLIEDKKGTKEHSNQLKRYKAIVERKHPGLEVVPVYFKMDVQSNYSAVKEAGYTVFGREKALALFAPYIASSEILNHFFDYVRELDIAINSYRNAKVSDWSKWFAWKGFYSYLQNEFGDAEWDYVSNRSGGFLGFWWHGKSIQMEETKFRIYLQLEYEKLIVKLHCKDKSQRKHVREVLRKNLYAEAGSLEVALKNHGRIGNSMGIVKFNQDYRILDQNGVMDCSETVKILKKAVLLIDRVAENLNS